METRESITQGSNQEVWKSVVGYEDLYEVSDHGNVRSLDRVAVGSNGVRRIKGRTMKPSKGSGGYRGVSLSRNGEIATFRIHRLVLSAFVGPCPAGQQVRHLNGVPNDNRLSNLAYGTPSENMRDRVTHGTHNEVNKTHCPRGHEHFDENNVPNQAKRERRSCLVCKRAQGYLYRRPGFPKSMEWAVFDMYLERFLLEESEKV